MAAETPRIKEPAKEFPGHPKISKISAMLGCRCPRCRVGKLFPNPAYNLRKFAVTYKICPHCGEDLRIEPGFYFGATYFSYGMNVLIVAISVAIYFMWFENSPEVILISCVAVAILLFAPLNFRLSRSTWLFMFGGVSFDPKYLNRENVTNLEVDFKNKKDPPVEVED